MTSLQTLPLPYFEVNTIEDAMDLSTEADRRYGPNENIDIDLDLTEDQHQDEPDEEMTEGFDNQPDPSTSNVQDRLEGADALMEDDRSSLLDEEIQDAEVTETHVDEYVDFESSADDGEKTPQDQVIDLQEAIDKLREQSSNNEHRKISQTIEQPGTKTDEETRIIAEEPKITDGQDLTFVSDKIDKALGVESRTDDIDTNEQAAGTAETETGEMSHIISNERALIQDTSVAALDPDSQETLHIGTDSYKDNVLAPSSTMHLIFVTYQDTEMTLFPTSLQDQDNTQTFLLEDEQLANENIQSLLRACRAILGETIDTEVELGIAIDELDLHISEVSNWNTSPLKSVSDLPQSATDFPDCSLAQIVALYVQLHRHDGEENAPPLYLQLYTRARFAPRWNYLLGILEQGKGLSQVRSTDEFEPEGSEGYSRYCDETAVEFIDNSTDPVAVAQQSEVGIDQADASVHDELQPQTSRVTVLATPNKSTADLGSSAMTQKAKAPKSNDASNKNQTILEVEDQQDEMPQAREDTNVEGKEEEALQFADLHAAQEEDDNKIERADSFVNDPQGHAQGSITSTSTFQGENDKNTQANAADHHLSPQSATAVEAASNIAEEATQSDLEAYGEDEYEDVQEEELFVHEQAEAHANQNEVAAEEPYNAVGPENYAEPDYIDDDVFLINSNADIDQGDDHRLPAEDNERCVETLQQRAKIQGDDEIVETDGHDHQKLDESEKEMSRLTTSGTEGELKSYEYLQQNALDLADKGANGREPTRQSKTSLAQRELDFLGGEQLGKEDDEITYDGEDDQHGFSTTPVAEQNTASSPASLKRPHSRSEEDLAQGNDPQS